MKSRGLFYHKQDRVRHNRSPTHFGVASFLCATQACKSSTSLPGKAEKSTKIACRGKRQRKRKKMTNMAQLDHRQDAGLFRATHLLGSKGGKVSLAHGQRVQEERIRLVGQLQMEDLLPQRRAFSISTCQQAHCKLHNLGSHRRARQRSAVVSRSTTARTAQRARGRGAGAGVQQS